MKLRSDGGAKNSCCREIVLALCYVKYAAGHNLIQRKACGWIRDAIVKNILAKRIGVMLRVMARIFIRCHLRDRGIMLVFGNIVEIGTSVSQ